MSEFEGADTIGAGKISARGPDKNNKLQNLALGTPLDSILPSIEGHSDVQERAIKHESLPSNESISSPLLVETSIDKAIFRYSPSKHTVFAPTENSTFLSPLA